MKQGGRKPTGAVSKGVLVRCVEPGRGVEETALNPLVHISSGQDGDYADDSALERNFIDHSDPADPIAVKVLMAMCASAASAVFRSVFR